MHITCPECSTSYAVSEQALGNIGRRVKCANCGAKWLATPLNAVVNERQAGNGLATADGDYALAPDHPDQSNYEAEFKEALNAEEAAPPDVAASDEALIKAQAAEAPDGNGPVHEMREDLQRAMGEDTDGPDLSAPVTSVPAKEDQAEAADEGGRRPGELERLLAEVEAGETDLVPSAAVPVGSKLAALRPRRRKPEQARAVWPALLCFCGALLVIAAVIWARAPLSAQFPNLAGLYGLIGFEVNLRGLEIRNVRTSQQVDRGTNLLLVEGVIANVTQQRQPVPAVHLTLQDEAGNELYGWTVNPNTQALDVAETVRLKTSIAAPPQGAAALHLRFLDR